MLMLKFKTIRETNIHAILKEIKTFNINPNYKESQFTKYFYNDPNKYWLGAFDAENRCVALAILMNQPTIKHVFLAEVQAFVKGSGKQLILHLLKKFKNIYWQCWSEFNIQQLASYYKSFGLNNVDVDGITYFYQSDNPRLLLKSLQS